ncbi:MAG: hypothetical protein LBK50_01120 [Candidatus Nomurabacteria bacterium]|jgi:hypothetical protein|nr:hypothetical protein [Candidatus Nomurabacteria bacterium]
MAQTTKNNSSVNFAKIWQEIGAVPEKPHRKSPSVTHKKSTKTAVKHAKKPHHASKKTPAKKRLPYIFVEEINIRPRLPQEPQIFEPVLVIERYEYGREEQIEKNIEPESVVAKTETAPAAPSGFNQVYDKILMARRAITAIQSESETIKQQKELIRATAIDSPSSSSTGLAAGILPKPRQFDARAHRSIERPSTWQRLTKNWQSFKKRLFMVL